MPTKKQRIALIGLGMAVTPHAQSLLDLRERVEVAYAFSRSAQRRAQFAERFDFPLCDNLAQILADPSVHAVIVLTPPNTHFDIVRRCVVAGKHILLEKPVERDTARAEQLVSLAEQAGLTLAMVFQHRFRPASVRLRELLEASALGQLELANVTIPWWRPQSYYDEPGRGSRERDGGGVLMTQAIHTLDLLLSLTGPVAEVAAMAGTTRLHRMESEDFVGAGLRFRSGALGALSATTALYPGFSERIEISGARGSAILAAGGLQVYYQDGREESTGEISESGGGADPMAFSHEPHRAVLANFLDALDYQQAPQVTGRMGLRVHRLIDALLQSAAEGRSITVRQA